MLDRNKSRSLILLIKKNTLDGTISFIFIQQSSAVNDYIRKKNLQFTNVNILKLLPISINERLTNILSLIHI